MKTLKFLVLTLLSIFSVFSCASGCASEQPREDQQLIEPAFEKVYVLPEDILIHSEGIFYLNAFGEMEPAQLVGSDGSGLYVIKEIYRCPVCEWFNSDDRCINIRCPLYGK